MDFTLAHIQSQTPKWILHLGFWFIYISSAVVVSGSIHGTYLTTLQWELTFWPIKATVVYIMVLYLLPQLLEKGRYVVFLLSMLLLLVGSGILIKVVIVMLAPFTTYPAEVGSSHLLLQAIRFGSHVYPVVALMGSIQVFFHFLRKQNESEQQTFERAQAELKLLKAQINPHFLFNSLNNLYALTLKQSIDASKVTLTLSEMLRYLIYECSEARVPLKKEISVIENYISMEKMRLGERVHVSFHMKGNIEPEMIIAPMIILPIVENCFKHGVEESAEGYVNINLIVNGQLVLKVDNSKNHNAQRSRSEGIGLENLKRRLDLEYGGKHELQIIEDDDSFLVKLTLSLGQSQKS